MAKFLTSVHASWPPMFASYEKGKIEKSQIPHFLIFLYVPMDNNTNLADFLGILHVIYLKHMTNSWYSDHIRNGN